MSWFLVGKGRKPAQLPGAVCLLSVSASATSLSHQGTLAGPEADAEFTFTEKHL